MQQGENTFKWKIKITSELLAFLLEEIDRYVGNMEHLIGPLQILLRT